MKQAFRKTLSLLLALSLLTALSLPAAASNALGEDLTANDKVLNAQTQLSTNVFWSTSYSDLRTENLITYTPNGAVTPIVTYGEALTNRTSVAAMASSLESQGYRVVAGINGDFYNTSNGLPIGLVVTDGILRSSDAGYHAIGFKADGSAVLGKPAVAVSAALGYGVSDGWNYTEYVRNITAVNKARVSTGGIYLYTYDFNDRHTTGTSEAGIDVLCTITEGSLRIGSTVTATVTGVSETSTATPIAANQFVLSVNLKSNSYQVDALRNLPAGSTVTLTVSSGDARWNDVRYGVGALYSLVENGAVVSGLAAGQNPRTAVGQKADGTLIFYTIDGRKSGHSIGASLSQVAERLVELGCVQAVCLDGGGSTNLAVTQPDSQTSEIVNTPSENGRSVTNQIFLVGTNQASGVLSHYYVEPESSYVLAGSQVAVTATGVDTNYIPMAQSYTLSASAGSISGNALTTPATGGSITVTASGGGSSGSAQVNAITTPDSIGIQKGTAAVTSLTLTPGATATLTGTATWNHLKLKADPACFTWSFTGDCGAVSSAGVFTASAPGSGTITMTAQGKTVSIPVTVSRIALKTVEDFESGTTILDGTYTDNARFTRSTAAAFVKLGRASGALEYTLTEERGYRADWRAAAPAPVDNQTYGALNLWVYGDGSGNTLELVYSSGTKGDLTLPVTKLDFTGWKQVSVSIQGDAFALQGLRVSAGVSYAEDGLGGVVPVYEETPRTGTIYLDQIVASFPGTVDTQVPSVTLTLDQQAWAVKAVISDTVDGLLPARAVSVSYNGAVMPAEYNAVTGTLTYALPGPGESHEAMRVTVTARDASGNIGRASLDIEPYGVEHKFTDLQDYWAATYVDFLYNAGITTGYDDGTFRPNQNISRQQFAVMLYRYLKLDGTKYESVTLPFADNGKLGEYALTAIRALYAEGIINGSAASDGKLYFNPDSSLTRAQAATMIGRTQEAGYASVSLGFTDAGKIPGYAAFYIQTMVAQGVISGYADGSFKPASNITRGQMAKILYNLM